MKIAACFLYVLLQIVCLSIGESNRLWGGINIITHISFVGYLCFLLESVRYFNKQEQLFFSYIKFISIANCVYIFFCIFKGKGFAVYNTDIFAYILGIGFLFYLCHAAISETKNK